MYGIAESGADYGELRGRDWADLYSCIKVIASGCIGEGRTRRRCSGDGHLSGSQKGLTHMQMRS